MTNITYELIGRKKVVKVLSFLKHKVKDLSPAFRKIGDNFREIEKKMFVRGGRPRKWKALDPVYAAWKAKNYPGRPTMILTGDLMRSLISLGGEHIQNILPQELTIGTSNPKGDWHHNGKGNLPKRRLISPTPADTTNWTTIIKNFIMSKVGIK